MADLFTNILEILILGTSLALILSLISLGYSLLYGVGKVINLAHGQFYFLAGYLIFAFSEYLDWSYLFSVVLGLIIATGLGALTYVVLIKPFHDNEIMILIATFSLGYLIFNFVWLAENLINLNVIPGLVLISKGQFVPGKFTIPGTEVQFSFYRLFVIGISAIIIILLITFIKYSKFGRAIRAVSQDQDAARLMGINLDGVLLFTVTISAFLAGVAAFLYVPLEPMLMGKGWDILLLSMSVVILGGMGSIPGTVIGAFVLAFAVKISEYFIDPIVGFPLSGIFHFIIIIIMLIIRPRGILGKEEKL
jgi:branched-chain amino acid transport system permease protein